MYQILIHVKNSILSIYITSNLPFPKNDKTDYNETKNGSNVILHDPTIIVVKSSTYAFKDANYPKLIENENHRLFKTSITLTSYGFFVYNFPIDAAIISLESPNEE